MLGDDPSGLLLLPLHSWYHADFLSAESETAALPRQRGAPCLPYLPCLMTPPLTPPVPAPAHVGAAWPLGATRRADGRCRRRGREALITQLVLFLRTEAALLAGGLGPNEQHEAALRRAEPRTR